MKGIFPKAVFCGSNKQTGYNVVWSAKMIKDAPRFNADFDNTPLETALKEALKNTSLNYTIQDKNISIGMAHESGAVKKKT
ncbi:STN domain-containing protein [Chitinophaga pinensis]|uniref:Secretin/TonB short N-terminal domain-containing protein n=1 Tax=Chitinophaga pinensis TaxID=79329 RepID=A0A5C6LI02_9BACT|nr:STN domain-containing protein [Chitinophaga pinensis]TWV90441.1 hypothetical protein FEF09_29510 [Chitinophaga pinensis]